jgi:hypothetical protein
MACMHARISTQACVHSDKCWHAWPLEQAQTLAEPSTRDGIKTIKLLAVNSRWTAYTYEAQEQHLEHVLSAV